MKINTALILCAGFGKRLNPQTLTTPKPLLELKDVTTAPKVDVCVAPTNGDLSFFVIDILLNLVPL